MIHKKVEVSETLKKKKRKKRTKTCACNIFTRIGQFFVKLIFNFDDNEKILTYTYLLMKLWTYSLSLGIIRFCLHRYLLFPRNFLLNRFFLVKKSIAKAPEEVGRMSNVFSFTSRDTHKPLFYKVNSLV